MCADTERPSKKLSSKRLGPYKVLNKVGAGSYELEIPGQSKIERVFNEKLLTPYNEPPPHRRDERPPPEIINDEPEYEVEKILKHRKIGRGTQYFVKWKGWGDEDSTWQSRKDLDNAQEIQDEYDTAHNIHIRAVPIQKADIFLKCFNPWKNIKKKYSERKIFWPHPFRKGGEFEKVDEPVFRDTNVSITGEHLKRSDEVDFDYKKARQNWESHVKKNTKKTTYNVFQMKNMINMSQEDILSHKNALANKLHFLLLPVSEDVDPKEGVMSRIGISEPFKIPSNSFPSILQRTRTTGLMDNRFYHE